MPSFVFNIVKGSSSSYFSLDPANSALIIVPLEFSGLESKSVLEDKTTLTQVLSGSTNEQTTMGRKVVTSTTSEVDNTLNAFTVSADHQTWISASGNQVGGFLVCYDEDTATGTDNDLIPLTYHEWDITPAGSDITFYMTNFFVSR